MKIVLIILGMAVIFFFILISALIVATTKYIHDNNLESQK